MKVEGLVILVLMALTRPAQCGDPNLLKSPALEVALQLVYQGVFYIYLSVIDSLLTNNFPRFVF